MKTMAIIFTGWAFGVLTVLVILLLSTWIQDRKVAYNSAHDMIYIQSDGKLGFEPDSLVDNYLFDGHGLFFPDTWTQNSIRIEPTINQSVTAVYNRLELKSCPSANDTIIRFGIDMSLK